MQKLLKAQVIKVKPVQEFSGGFRKQEIVLECGDKYPSPVQFQIHKENIEKLNVKEGEILYDINYNLKGKEWPSPSGEIKYFNTLEIWKVSRTENSEPLPPGVTPKMNGDMAQEFNDSQTGSGEEPLPF